MLPFRSDCMTVSRVLIVGGGIAGLATAAGLRKAGISCEIVERASQWAPVGAGIVMSVNAMSVLRRIGVGERAADSGVELGRGAITDADGNELSSIDFGSLRSEFGPTIAIHRAALHAALLDAAGDVPVSLSTSIESLVQQPEHVEVELTDGRQEEFDLVLGADGLHSQVRKLTFGEIPIDYSGYTCWRMIVECPSDDVAMREMWGRGLRFGLAPVGNNQLYCFAVANAPRGEADPLEGRLDRFRKRFASFGGQVPDVLSALTHPEELLHADLEEIPKSPWFERRVALLGDAAHAMTPNMGQGAAMALEDSAVLVENLTQPGSLEERLEGWVGRRASRVRWVQNQSRRIGKIGQLEGAFGCFMRNAVMSITPERAAAGALRKLASQPI
jgi:2-polyprenyl-6-methoxyphenol hydroxylase-like FAD-dependent oxidoreductase